MLNECYISVFLFLTPPPTNHVCPSYCHAAVSTKCPIKAIGEHTWKVHR